MRPDERRERIVDLVREHERVTVEFLAMRLDTSRETIRRDLGDLDGRGLLRKVHGGATAAEPGAIEPQREGPFQARMLEHVRAKRAIARRAAALFRPGDTLFVDTGTTTLFFAEELQRVGGLTVITNSATIASLVSRGSDNVAYLIGGAYRDEAAESLGALAVEQIGRFHATHAVLTVAAIDPAGFLDFDLQEAEVARAMLAQARRLTVLADTSKLGRSGLFEVAPLAAADRLVIEAPVDGEIGDALAAAEVEIVVAREPARADEGFERADGTP